VGGEGWRAGRHRLAQGCGQPPPAESGEQLGTSGRAGKGKMALDEGRRAQSCQVPALLLGHRRGGTGPRAMLLAANKLKIKPQTAQETSGWKGGSEPWRGCGFPFDINFTLTGNKTDMKGKTREQQKDTLEIAPGSCRGLAGTWPLPLRAAQPRPGRQPGPTAGQPCLPRHCPRLHCRLPSRLATSNAVGICGEK